MLIHFRREGRVRRTICGQRWRPGMRPKLWRRDWADMHLPEATEEQVHGRRRCLCPVCVNTVAEESERARLKAAEPKKPRRWGEGPRSREHDVDEAEVDL